MVEAMCRRLFTLVLRFTKHKRKQGHIRNSQATSRKGVSIGLRDVIAAEYT